MTTSSLKSNAKTRRRSTVSKPPRKTNERSAENLQRGDEDLTQHLINLLQQNINPWHRDWTTFFGKGPHRNIDSGHEYSGSNPAILELWTALRCYSHPLWIGAGQGKKHNWMPRKGSKGCAIMLPVQITYRKRDQDGKELKDNDGNSIMGSFGTFKYSKIFNVQDIHGVTEEAEAKLQEKIRQECESFTPLEPTARLERAERVLGAWSVPTTWSGNKAFYSPSEDRITMPGQDQFLTSEGMYSTWAHEQLHSTGHKSRLNRELGGGFDSVTYAREELVAELGAFLVCNRLQISSDVLNHAAYLKHWIEVLKESPDALRKCLSDASKAANLLCNVEEENPM